MVTENKPKDAAIIENISAPVSGTSSFFNREIDAEKIFYIIISKWPIIILCTLLGYFASNLYLRYATPRYSANTKLLIKDTRYSGGMSEAVVFEDLGILNAGRNLDNEIQILRTSFLMEEVVKRLNLQYNYKSQGRLKSRDLYKESPVTILSWDPNDSASQRSFEINVTLLENDQFTMLIEGKKYTGQFGQSIKIPNGRITLGNIEYGGIARRIADSKEVLISIKSITSAANQYNRNLTVAVDQKSRSTVLDLSVTDQNPQRAIEIIRELINVYNESEISDKNRIFENTVKFIDERMEILGGELREVEGDVATFKSQTGAIDLIGEGAILLDQSSESSKEISILDGQLEIIRAIRAQLIKEATMFDFAPTSESLTTTSLNGLLSTFNQLLLERERLRSKLGPENPEIILVEKQLANLRINIIENVNNIERDLLIKRNTLSAQDRVISNRIRTLPATQKQLIEIQRQQVIKQQLYLYLLQKREESALSLSVTVANNRVIEPPKFNGQVSPNVRQIELFSISLGFLFPIAFLLIAQAINKKVMIEDHIVQNTAAPILGTIPQSEQDGHVVISERKRSAGAEMFRLVRANLQFVGEGVNNRVLVLTSSISGEGKSFITLNLGLTLALGNKKVMIIELDMRKPKLANYLGYKKGAGKGVTDYLVDTNLGLDSIINVSSHHDNLHFIPCGQFRQIQVNYC
jgi:tyrosine-protein kinase Etk/Wzc